MPLFSPPTPRPKALLDSIQPQCSAPFGAPHNIEEIAMLDEQFRAMSEEADREAMASARMLGYALLVTTLAFFSWIFWAVFA